MDEQGHAGVVSLGAARPEQLGRSELGECGSHTPSSLPLSPPLPSAPPPVLAAHRDQATELSCSLQRLTETQRLAALPVLRSSKLSVQCVFICVCVCVVHPACSLGVQTETEFIIQQPPAPR